RPQEDPQGRGLRQEVPPVRDRGTREGRQAPGGMRQGRVARRRLQGLRPEDPPGGEKAPGGSPRPPEEGRRLRSGRSTITCRATREDRVTRHVCFHGTGVANLFRNGSAERPRAASVRTPQPIGYSAVGRW